MLSLLDIFEMSPPYSREPSVPPLWPVADVYPPPHPKFDFLLLFFEAIPKGWSQKKIMEFSVKLAGPPRPDFPLKKNIQARAELYQVQFSLG